MGKKSKSKAKESDASRILYKPKGNEIPLYRQHDPSFFRTLVDELNPIKRFDAGETWMCIDDDSFVRRVVDKRTGEMVAERQTVRQHGFPAECPICFRNAQELCSRCSSVFYCGEECQKKHWKLVSSVHVSVDMNGRFTVLKKLNAFPCLQVQCHKKACEQNPGRYRFNINMNQFRSLPEEAFDGHEFLIIKPTEKLHNLNEICDVCLEPADDIFQKVPGFGNDQIQPLWLMDNSSHPISKEIRKYFGWTSHCHGVDTLEGYRLSEDHFVYMIMYDDNFLSEMELSPSYYGDACFPHAREGNHTRGNVVIFKLFLKNKKRKKTGLSHMMTFICSDDDDLEFEHILYPVTKAEIAFMLQERMTAIEQGKYTRRQWRYVIRRAEKRVEITARGGMTLSI